MNEKERDFSTLDLEDIIKEFGGGKYPAPEEMVNTADLLEVSAAISGATLHKQPEEVSEEPAVEEASEEELPAEEPVEEAESVEEAPEAVETPAEEIVDEPTIRLEDLSQVELKQEVTEDTPVEEPTIRLEDLSQVEVPAEPVEEPTIRLDDEALAQLRANQAPAEAASDMPQLEKAEETEYDDEDDDEVELPHLPPLIFKPKSKLQQLRSELVAGPEKRYYEMTETGVGKLQIAMFLCIVVILLSGSAAVMYTAGMIAAERLRLMIFGQVLAMLVGGLLGSQQMIDGVCDLFRGRFTLNTLLCCSFAACCADGVFCLLEERVPFCAAFTLQALMSQWAAYHKRTTEMGQMDSLRKAVRLDSVVAYPDYYEGKTGFLRGEGKVSDFMEQYGELSLPEKRQNRFAFFSLLASIAVAVVAGVNHSVSMAVQILSTTLLVAIPAGMFVTITRPTALVERKLHSYGTVLCGWSGIKGLCVKGVIPLRDKDFFPTGSAKLNGVKFYGDRNPDEVIAYAAAMVITNGGCLAPIFEQLLNSRSGVVYTAENLQYYGNGGIGGEIRGEPVLIGTVDFLKEMGVEIPDGTMVKQAVYISIDGEFSGLFAINYSRSKFTASGLTTLTGHRRAIPVMAAWDFMITPAFLKEKFGIREKRMKFPDRAAREEMAAKTVAGDEPALALTTQEGLAPVAYAITGARALRTSIRLGMTIHIIGGLLGMLIMLALAIVGAVHLLTPVHILLYQLIWLVPGWLVTLWPKTI